MSNWAQSDKQLSKKIYQFSLNDCWSKLLGHMFYNFLSYGFGYGLRPKAEVFQGWTFGYGRRWKLGLRSNTAKYLCHRNWISDILTIWYYIFFEWQITCQIFDLSEFKAHFTKIFWPHCVGLIVIFLFCQKFNSKCIQMHLKSDEKTHASRRFDIL